MAEDHEQAFDHVTAEAYNLTLFQSDYDQWIHLIDGAIHSLETQVEHHQATIVATQSIPVLLLSEVSILMSFDTINHSFLSLLIVQRRYKAYGPHSPKIGMMIAQNRKDVHVPQQAEEAEHFDMLTMVYEYEGSATSEENQTRQRDVVAADPNEAMEAYGIDEKDIFPPVMAQYETAKKEASQRRNGALTANMAHLITWISTALMVRAAPHYGSSDMLALMTKWLPIEHGVSRLLPTVPMFGIG